MFFITDDQQRILSVLEHTGWLRLNQATRILSMIDKGKDEAYAARVLKQLQYMQKVFWKTAELVTQPHLSGKQVDKEMLAAVDIMLDLLDGSLLAVSAGRPPFTLSFLTESQQKISSYGVVIVAPGSEAYTNFLLEDSAASCTVILLLTDLAQRGYIRTLLPHFFALHENGKYRYYKGSGG